MSEATRPTQVAAAEAALIALRVRGRAIAVAVLAVLLVLQATETLPFQARLRAFLFDAYQVVAPRERGSAPVVVVDVDEPSIERFGQWPWPRSLVAQLVERIADARPAAVGLDILMPEPDRTSACAAARYVPGITAEAMRMICGLPGNDILLAGALGRADAVITLAGVQGGTPPPLRIAPMMATGGDPRGAMFAFDTALVSIEDLQASAGGHAMVNADPEWGIVRRMPMVARIGETTVVPSLPLEMLRKAAGVPGFTVRSDGGRITGVAVADVQVPTQADGRLWIHYGRYRHDRYVSAVDVLDGKVPASRLERRLVLIGVSGLGLVDFPLTALGERVPGVEMHTQVLESIFDGTTLLRPSWAPATEVVAFGAIGLGLVFGLTRIGSMASMLALLVATGSMLLGGLLLFQTQRWLIDAATPSLMLVLVFGGMLTFELMREQAQRVVLQRSLRQQREAAARLAGEVAAARKIQLGMVPDARAAFAAEPRLAIAARMEPARDVGGDLYDCFMIDEDRMFFLVGDVCGKGIPASLFMATSKTLCKSVALRGDAEIGRMMSLANLEIARENSEMLFVTAFAGVLDLRTGELAYANAGHERPWVARPGQPPLSLDGPGGPPLGIVDEFDYPVTRLALDPTALLCVVTDGVSEANDPEQALFGMPRLEALLAETADPDPEALVERIFRAVDAFAAGSDRADDVTVLALRWVGAPPGLRPREDPNGSTP